MQPGHEPLTLDRLRRIQATLTRRAAQRDPANVLQVGFAPQRNDRANISSQSCLPVTAQFDVQRKLQRMPEERRIDPVESVRLLDRGSGRYLTLELATDVLATGEILPTGVRVERGTEQATTSVVVRWTKTSPAPPCENVAQAEDPRWRWGVLSVAHLFVTQGATMPVEVRVQRQSSCGVGPEFVRGHLLARGRIPGGPDISLIETGLDRLWLSGLLPRPAALAIASAREEQLLSWISSGTDGSFIGDGVTHDWRWQTFYPELYIESLGRLRHIVRYQAASNQTVVRPFGPGSSGGLLLAGGIPIGLQIAAVSPGYQVAFAQSFDVSLSWLQARLRATSLQIVHLLLNGA